VTNSETGSREAYTGVYLLQTVDEGIYRGVHRVYLRVYNGGYTSLGVYLRVCKGGYPSLGVPQGV